MRHSGLPLTVLLLASALAMTPSAQSPNTLSASEKTAGWRLLFDGTTTAGWHLYGKAPAVLPARANGWDVVDGTLVALGKGTDSVSDIVSNEDFENFELVIDWKVGPKANSGILYNVVEKVGAPIYASGPEYQLIDEDGWPDPLNAWQKNGANYAMHPPLVKSAKPVGQWNHTRIVVNRGHVEHWLNDAKTAEYDLWTPEWTALKAAGKWKDYPDYGMAKQGKLGLQNHGNQVWFKDIKIKAATSRE
jgi:hypothetical protein